MPNNANIDKANAEQQIACLRSCEVAELIVDHLYTNIVMFTCKLMDRRAPWSVIEAYEGLVKLLGTDLMKLCTGAKIRCIEALRDLMFDIKSGGAPSFAAGQDELYLSCVERCKNFLAIDREFFSDKTGASFTQTLTGPEAISCLIE